MTNEYLNDTALFVYENTHEIYKRSIQANLDGPIKYQAHCKILLISVLSKVIHQIYVCIYLEHFKTLFKEHTSYLEHFEIPAPFPVARCQIELIRKDMTVLSGVAQILYKACLSA